MIKMQTMDPNNSKRDDEAQALADCYRLLLQKAAERRARLAQAHHGQESLSEEQGINEKTTA